MEKIIKWLIRKLVTFYYKHYPFYTYSWGIDEHTDLYVISEESYFDRHRFGLREENITCNHTDEEIAESFISDVESVKESLLDKHISGKEQQGQYNTSIDKLKKIEQIIDAPMGGTSSRYNAIVNIIKHGKSDT